jgi:hypothetical protein
MSHETKNAAQPEQLSIYDRYGTYTIVTASLHNLLSFLLRQLKYLGSRKESDFGSIVAWASNLIDQVSDSRSDIWDKIEEIAYDYPKSGWRKVLNCYVKYSLGGQSRCHCDWFDSPNTVPKKVIEENPMTLGEGRCCHLLDEICYRFERVLNRIAHEGTCDNDLIIENFFKDRLSCFDAWRSQAWTEVTNLEARREEYRNSKTRTNTNSDPHFGASKPKRDSRLTKDNGKRFVTDKKPNSDVVKKEQVENAVEAPKVLRLPPSKPVSEKFSYANMAGSRSSQKTVDDTTATFENNIINIDDNCPPVDDPNVETEESQMNNFVPDTFMSESSSIPLTKKEKKALKRSGQRKRKAALKATEVTDLSIEEPTEAKELCAEPLPIVNAPQSDACELVEVEMMRLVNGKPVYSKVIMTRGEYAAIAKIPSVVQ